MVGFNLPRSRQSEYSHSRFVPVNVMASSSSSVTMVGGGTLPTVHFADRDYLIENVNGSTKNKLDDSDRDFYHNLMRQSKASTNKCSSCGKIKPSDLCICHICFKEKRRFQYLTTMCTGCNNATEQSQPEMFLKKGSAYVRLTDITQRPKKKK